jgi:geranylgeranyl reductase family protein
VPGTVILILPMSNGHSPKYDVTIVGSGPAGTILAYELARKGIKTLILEKYKMPRHKVCAGGVTVRAHALLPFDINSIVENVIYGARLSYNRLPRKIRTYDKPLIYSVMRDKFDHFLALKALEAGASLEDGVEVKHIEKGIDNIIVHTRDNKYSTPILVGADGANSIVVQSLGLRNGFEHGLGVNGIVDITNNIAQEWDGLIGLDYGISGGYAWVFPKKGHLSVGAGSSFRLAKKLKPYTLKLISNYRFGTVGKQGIRGHLMPVRKSNTPLSFERILLVGDAAGLIDPLTGEGIYYALKSAHMAASAIAGFLEGKTPDLKEYERCIDRELMPELKAARTIQKMNSAAPRIFFYYLNENDRFWKAFCGLLRGERTYVGLKKRLNLPLRLLFRVL